MARGILLSSSSFLAIASSCWLAIALNGSAGCDDGSYLAPDPPTTTTSSSSGMGGAGGAGGEGAGGEGGAPVEPPGPAKLTVVNGVNDHEAIRLCFLPYPGSDGAGIEPWPSNAAGLGFAEGAAIMPVEAVAPAGADLQLHVIAGDLAATAGLDCAEILALAAGGAGQVVTAALPVVPASAFAAERSLLLVPAGCVGGPGHSDPAEESGCGPGYTEATPTATLVAGPMSRLTEAGALGLQVVHASVALPVVDVGLTSGDTSEWVVAAELSLGAIAPFPPYFAVSAVELGPPSAVSIRTYPPGQGNPTSEVSLGEVLDRSALAPADIIDGEGFVLVAVGATPGAGAGPFWHELTYALVRADP